VTREPPSVVFENGGFAERWIEHRPGWAAVCYRNQDTERTIWGVSERTGRFALARTWLWAARRFSPWLSVREVEGREDVKRKIVGRISVREYERAARDPKIQARIESARRSWIRRYGVDPAAARLRKLGVETKDGDDR
jgi:hypothetical protein